MFTNRQADFIAAEKRQSGDVDWRRILTGIGARDVFKDTPLEHFAAEGDPGPAWLFELNDVR